VTVSEMKRLLPQAVPVTPLRAGAQRKSELVAAAYQNLLALADQGIVSGTNFAASVLIGRAAGTRELGLYSLGFSLALLLVSVQDSLISLPYTIYHRRRDAAGRVELAGSALVHCGLLSLLAIAAGAAAGAATWWIAALRPLATVLWVLAATAPFLLLREFYRRLEFAHLRPSRALTLDLVAGVLQLAGMAGMAVAATLSAAGAFAARGFASAVAGAIGAFLGRRRIRALRERVASDWAIQRAVGKWILAGQMAGVAQAYAMYWLLAWRLGAAATGAFAACSTLVLLSNPFMIGVGNVLMPRTAHAYADGGAAELRRVVGKSTLLVGGVMAVFCGLLGLFGDQALTLFFGDSYEGQGHTVAVLATALLVNAVGMAADTGLQASEHPAASFRANLVAVCVMLGLAVCLVDQWQLVGAAYGVLAGNLAGTWFRVQAFLRLTCEGCLVVATVPNVTCQGADRR
jgi:O-antigen/teichoic acid export membrane protein